MTDPGKRAKDPKAHGFGRREILMAALPLALAGTGLLAPSPGAAKTRSPDFRNNAHQFRWLRPQVVPRETPFLTAGGGVRTLRHFRGKTVLVNFWATWCPPCLAEMPSLDRLQKALGGDRFTVLAISIDRLGLDAVLPFYRRMGIENLEIYLDPDQRTGYLDSAKAGQGAFALYALPISYLIDRQGRALGYFPGGAAWDSPQALDFLGHFIG